MSGLLKSVVFSVLFCVGQQALAQDYSQREAAKPLIEAAVKAGFSADEVKQLLSEAVFQDDIIKAISKPAEKRLNWGQYRDIFLTQKRIDDGVVFWNKHQQTLQQAEQTYGVPAAYIVAILGVETFYGRHTGKYRVLDALATLGFDYEPRAKFFYGQLQEFLLMSREAHIDPRNMMGSYAGAMGMAQFIPSSYRHYAVDFDQDGVTNLAQPVDAIGSVANYFAEHRWKPGLAVAAPVTPNSKAASLFVTDYAKPSQTLGQLQNNIKATRCTPQSAPADYCLPDLPDNTAITPLTLEGKQGNEHWLTTDNFYTITRYNHSPLYAMAVFQLAMNIQQARDTAP